LNTSKSGYGSIQFLFPWCMFLWYIFCRCVYYFEFIYNQLSSQLAMNWFTTKSFNSQLAMGWFTTLSRNTNLPHQFTLSHPSPQFFLAVHWLPHAMGSPSIICPHSALTNFPSREKKMPDQKKMVAASRQRPGNNVSFLRSWCVFPNLLLY